MHDKHAHISGSTIHFEFRGKSGIEHEIDLTEPRLAAIVRKCQDLPGQQFFQYVDADGTFRHMDSADVNQRVGGSGSSITTATTWPSLHVVSRNV